MSQKELAIQVGAGRVATVSMWENEKTRPDKGTLRLIADLTAQPDAVFGYLMYGGSEPAIATRGSEQLGGGTAVPQAMPKGLAHGMPPAILPAMPPAMPKGIPMGAGLPWEDERVSERMREHFGEYVRRVSLLAASGTSVPAYLLLEGATMLLRLSDQYAHLMFRVQAILKECPLMVLEFDAEDRLVGFHCGKDREEIYQATADKIGAPIDAIGLSDAVVAGMRPALAKMRTGAGVGEVAYPIAFKDGARRYLGTLVGLPEGHVLLLVRSESDVRRSELGLGGKRAARKMKKGQSR